MKRINEYVRDRTAQIINNKYKLYFEYCNWSTTSSGSNSFIGIEKSPTNLSDSTVTKVSAGFQGAHTTTVSKGLLGSPYPSTE
jgi:hypothetical protein